MIHIALADDQLLFRRGLRALIEKFEDMKVLIEANDGQELLDLMAPQAAQIQVAIIDLSMPRLNGLDTLKHLKTTYPEIKCIILTVHEEDLFIHKLISEGADAYLAKNSEPQEIEQAIRSLVKSGFYFNEQTVMAMRSALQKKQKAELNIGLNTLTNREREVLCLICQEFTSAEIGEKLFISESTVNGHRNNLLLKIGCKNTAGLVSYAFRNQLFEPDIL